MKNIALAVTLAFAACQAPPPEVAEVPETFTLAFASCATQDSTNLVWPAIQAHNPDLFVWLGDNIYGDSHDTLVLAEKYARQKAQPLYQAFLKTGVPIVGTWDDHDYGWNDAGKEYPHRQASKTLLLNFLDVPADAAVRSREGVYQSFTYGNAGRQVHLILLDTRWFRDSLAPDTTGKGRYVPRNTGTLLGATQWQWLGNELNSTSADVVVIGSSIQVISAEHGWEKWANFSLELERLYKMLDACKAKNIIILSGDRHQAEISCKQLASGKWVYDVTSSGMTHVFARPTVEPNAYRTSPLILRRNWGVLNITWQADSVDITTELRGIADTLYVAEKLTF